MALLASLVGVFNQFQVLEYARFSRCCAELSLPENNVVLNTSPIRAFKSSLTSGFTSTRTNVPGV